MFLSGVKSETVYRKVGHLSGQPCFYYSRQFSVLFEVLAIKISQGIFNHGKNVVLLDEGWPPGLKVANITS